MEYKIETRTIGPNSAPLVIAEIGINHSGNIKVAKELVDAAISAGAEIIKTQTHIPDAEMSLEARSVIPGNANISIYKIIESCALSLKEEEELANYIRSQKKIYMSTPFSFEAIEFLDSIQVPAFKIGSGECNNYPFVEAVASKGKPVIMSTGMNSVQSIAPSVAILREAGVPFTLMHCTNLYPTPDKLIRLNAINELGDAFPDASLGLSDHSVTNYPCIAAVALGAQVLERHFTDTRERTGPDIPCSMNSAELSELIRASRIVHEATKGNKFPVEEENVTIAFAFASVVATKRLKAGHKIRREDITLKRPAGGDFGPTDFNKLIGKEVTEEIEPNIQIRTSQVNN